MLIRVAVVALCLTSMPVHAQLKIDPEHPYYFRDGAEHVYLLGASDRNAFFVWQNDKGFDWRDYLQVLHDYGFNYVRQDVTSWEADPGQYPAQFSNPAWLFLRPGPGLAVDGSPKFDLARFNEEYFRSRIRPFLARACELGIYVELTLFNHSGGHLWQPCLYNDQNNVNQLGLASGEPESDRALDNQALLAIQEAYVTKVLAETADFGNVIYEICNESGGAKWVTHFVDFIHNHPHYPSHLVSAGEQSSSFDPVTGPNDIIVKHRGWGKGGGLYATDSDVKNHHDVLLKYRAGKPVTHNEYFLYANQSTDDPNFVRKMMWADFAAGGHSNFYDFAHWRGTGRTNEDGQPAHPPPREILAGGRHLSSFVKRIPFWEMTPADHCLTQPDTETHAMALAAPGQSYVVYLLGEQVSSIKLAVPEGDYRLQWYDPKTGEQTEASPVGSVGGQLVLAVPSFDQDVVLWLHTQAR